MLFFGVHCSSANVRCQGCLKCLSCTLLLFSLILVTHKIRFGNTYVNITNGHRTHICTHRICSLVYLLCFVNHYCNCYRFVSTFHLKSNPTEVFILSVFLAIITIVSAIEPDFKPVLFIQSSLFYSWHHFQTFICLMCIVQTTTFDLIHQNKFVHMKFVECLDFGFE